MLRRCALWESCPLSKADGANCFIGWQVNREVSMEIRARASVDVVVLIILFGPSLADKAFFC